MHTTQAFGTAVPASTCTLCGKHNNKLAFQQVYVCSQLALVLSLLQCVKDKLLVASRAGDLSASPLW